VVAEVVERHAGGRVVAARHESVDDARVDGDGETVHGGEEPVAVDAAALVEVRVAEDLEELGELWRVLVLRGEGAQEGRSNSARAGGGLILRGCDVGVWTFRCPC
jgi:hypothetical protein